jgi:lysophospholipase L1-like esterase
MKNKFIYLSILVAGLVSCEPEFENAVDANYTAGEADFSTYVAIGNSLTAGYMDGTVSRVGQSYSFPNLLSKQFATVGGGEFTQPSYEEDVNNLGGFSGLPGFNTRLVINAAVGAPQPIAGTSTITLTPQATAYNNMGVPGAKSFHLLAPGYGNSAGVALGLANPYYVRHATSATSTVLGDALSKNPTFFTNWIGANDILSYATSGGTKSDGSPADDHNVTGNTNPATYGGNDITNSAVFAGTYSAIIDQLTANGAKGVVCTIPSVTSIPYFTTVPYNPLSPTALGGSANINALNSQLYGPLSSIFTAYGEPNRVKLLSATAANPILIYDVDAADRSAQITGALTPSLGAATAGAFGAIFGKARQATANDLIVLTASSVIGSTNASSPSPLININGVSFPMANKWVLTATEQIKVANATSSYNNSIVAIASSKNLAIADMNAILNQLVNGLRSVDGSLYTANYFSGAATENKVLFSLDGVHPNPRGYAVIANEIIKVINSHYKSNMPYLSPVYFPGINIVATN